MAEPSPMGATEPRRASISTVRVRYAETDQMGVAYYANYFVWFEVARTDWLREAGLTYRAIEADGVMLPVIAARCAYRASARYDDALTVRATAKLVSAARLAFDYEITGPDGLVAEGETVHATVDRTGSSRCGSRRS